MNYRYESTDSEWADLGCAFNYVFLARSRMMLMFFVQQLNIDIWATTYKRNSSPLCDVQPFKRNFSNTILYPETKYIDIVVYQNM